MWVEDLIKNPPLGWEEFIQENKQDLIEIEEILETEKETMGPIEPDDKNFFVPYYLTPLKDIKVVFVTVQPLEGTVYGTTDLKSQGWGCSVRDDDMIPHSTKNIYKELERSNIGFIEPIHGNLTSWAKKGVFFLTLSVSICPVRKYRKLGNHMKVWAIISRKTCELISSTCKNAVFVLVGKETQHVRNYI